MSDNDPTRDYLGDGVYVRMEGDVVVLTTENGIEATNRIFLEPIVLDALKRYLERMKGEHDRQTPD